MIGHGSAEQGDRRRGVLNARRHRDDDRARARRALPDLQAVLNARRHRDDDRRVLHFTRFLGRATCSTPEGIETMIGRYTWDRNPDQYPCSTPEGIETMIG